jgi:hypothetical protein
VTYSGVMADWLSFKGNQVTALTSNVRNLSNPSPR